MKSVLCCARKKFPRLEEHAPLWGSGRWGQRAGLSEAKEARGEAATSRNGRRQSGRWGVAQGCNCRSILDVIATLIEAQRPDLAMVLIEGEMNSQN